MATGSVSGDISADAFALVSDDTRVAILRALHELDTPVAFSALYEQLAVGDSAHFNYHLSELRPQFVTKTADGYELTAGGRRLSRAVVAGRYTDSPTVEPDVTTGRLTPSPSTPPPCLLSGVRPGGGDLVRLDRRPRRAGAAVPPRARRPAG
ncbi:MAG: hypothetical protein V5A56_10705 [Halolamina sp.]